ncbi:GTPase-associated system all-helical protein GASH [Blastococcus tunisiensis]|uniref:Uncharacterized protein n=1 Tax=Blastococcus tunisiensis TaxID=1798228 RepID=A0A1I1VY19_9ACTN|nr:GTPase-associated system all-helical protein GASH [Blastococcus sp. DSM 46838]SFD87986.1 hypothetical protein SAMN05216574_101160 [Blastococcus sp. DSM 46838]
MNPLLADWYNEVSIGASAEMIAARGAALDELLPDLAPAQVMGLVGLAHERGEGDSDEWFRAVFKRHDASFLMRENGREVALLAGACLMDVSASGGDTAVLAASAVAVASRLGWSSVVGDLPTEAEQRLVDLGTSRRQLTRPPAAIRQTVWTKSVQTGAAKDMEAGVTAESVAAAIARVGTAVNAALESAAAQLDAVSEWAERSLDLCAEESDLMAWLLTGQSRTLGLAWSAADPATAAVVAGREIAELLALAPAPPQADALIDQMLASTRFPKRAAAELELPPLEVPAELEFLVQNAPWDGQDPAALGRLSLRQAVLLDVWSGLE